MVGTVGTVAKEVVDLIVSGDRVSWEEFTTSEVVERLLPEDLPRESNTVPHLLHVLLGAQVVGNNNGMFVRISRSQFEVSLAGWPHGSHVELEGVARPHLPAVVVDGGGQEVPLDVWVGHPGPTPDEPPRLEVGRCCIARGAQEPFETDLDHVVWELPLSGIQRDGFGAGLLDVHLEVVLEVAAHPWEMSDRRNAQRLQVICVANPRQHQQLWRVDGSTAEDDLFADSHLLHLTLVFELQPDDPGCVEGQPVSEGSGQCVQVLSVEDGPEVRSRRTPPEALVDVHVHPAHPLLLEAVHVVGERVAGLHPSVDERLEQGVGRPTPADMQWTGPSPVLVCT